MRVGAFAPVVLALVASGCGGGGYAHVHATIGRNAVPMPERSTSYRLGLDGTATLVATRPVPPADAASPNGRYHVQFETSRVVLIDRRTGVCAGRSRSTGRKMPRTGARRGCSR